MASILFPTLTLATLATTNTPQLDYHILQARVSERNLITELFYGGGCKTHEFYLKLEDMDIVTDPPPIQAEIMHNNNNDTCERAITKTLTFDIGGMIDQVTQNSHYSQGQFQLYLTGYGMMNVDF